MRTVFVIIFILLIAFNIGCVKKQNHLGFEAAETNEVTEVYRNRYSIVKSIRMNKAMDDAMTTEQLQQSMAEEASKLCLGNENIVSNHYNFTDAISISHGMTEREKRKSQFKSGFIKKITAYITCQNESVYHVSTKQIEDKKYRVIKEIIVYAEEIDVEKYEPALIKAAEDEAKKLCGTLNEHQMSYEFSSIAVTGSGSRRHPPQHTTTITANITCQ
jgi:hypothetical protein